MARDKGTCRWEVARGQECGKPAVANVTLRERIGSARVAVCETHRAEYNQRSVRLRKSS